MIIFATYQSYLVLSRLATPKSYVNAYGAATFNGPVSYPYSSSNSPHTVHTDQVSIDCLWEVTLVSGHPRYRLHYQSQKTSSKKEIYCQSNSL